MGIDRIGKPPAPPPPANPSASSASGGSRLFEIPSSPTAPSTEAGSAQAPRPADAVAGGGPAPAAAGSAAAPVAELDRVRAGSMPLDRYVDSKVEEATSHLVGLPSAQLQTIRAALRERVATDPTLIELFRTATGAAPPAADD